MLDRLPTAAAVAVAVTLVLAGCGSAPEPAALAGPATSASVPPPVAGGPPADAPADSAPGATPEADVEAAVRAYVAAANEAMATLDTTAFRRAVTQDCTCLDFAERIDEIESRGGDLGAAHWEIAGVRPVLDGRDGFALVDLREAAYTMRSGVGLAETYSEAVFVQAVRLHRVDREWRITDVDEVE